MLLPKFCFQLLLWDLFWSYENHIIIVHIVIQTVIMHYWAESDSLQTSCPVSLVLPVWFFCPLSPMSYRCEVQIHTSLLHVTECPAGCQAGRMGQRRGWFVFRWSWSVGCCPVIAPYYDFSQDLNSKPWDSLLKVCRRYLWRRERKLRLMGNCRVARALPHCHAVRGVLSPQIAQSSCDPMVIPYEGLGYSLLCLLVIMMIL